MLSVDRGSDVAPCAAFALIAACCRRPVAAPATLRRLAGAIDDWERVIDLAVRHRVIGFVNAAHGAFPTLPPATQHRLHALARANAAQNLRNVQEELRLDAALRESGIKPLFLKGTAIGGWLYGSFAIKTSWDVDVMVVPDELDRAGEVLHALGYQPQYPAALAPHLTARYRAAQKEMVWTNASVRTAVELHRALVDYPGVIAGLGPDSPRRAITVGTGRAIETFADAEHFAYLAVHGTIHGWARLKWLADVSAFLTVTERPVEALYRQAVALGAGRAPAVALLLCEHLFELPLAPTFRDELARDPGTRRLVCFALRMMDVGGARAGYLDRLSDAAGLMRSHLLLVPGAAASARIACSMLVKRRWGHQLALPTALVVPATLAVLPARLIARWARLRRVRRAS